MLGSLLLALSATLLPLSTPRQHIAPLVVPKHFAPVVVPFEYYNRHIFVTLTLDGHPGMVFLLDSGTNKNILNLRTSEELGLKPVSVRQAKGLGLGSGKVKIAAAKDIDAKIGNIQVANIMAVVDLRGLETHFGHREDGILGFPFLQRFVVVLDFTKDEMTLLPSKRYSYRGSGDMLYLSHRSKSATIPIVLNAEGRGEHRANVEIDTGSDVTLLLYSHYVRGAHLEEAFLSQPMREAYGLGGYFPMQVGLVQSMSMGHTQASHLYIFRMERDHPNTLEKDCVGMIGTSFLQQFQKIVFDIPGNRIILELRPVTQESANRHAAPPVR